MPPHSLIYQCLLRTSLHLTSLDSTLPGVWDPWKHLLLHSPICFNCHFQGPKNPLELCLIASPLALTFQRIAFRRDDFNPKVLK